MGDDAHKPAIVQRPKQMHRIASPFSIRNCELDYCKAWDLRTSNERMPCEMAERPPWRSRLARACWKRISELEKGSATRTLWENCSIAIRRAPNGTASLATDCSMKLSGQNGQAWTATKVRAVEYLLISSNVASRILSLPSIKKATSSFLQIAGEKMLFKQSGGCALGAKQRAFANLWNGKQIVIKLACYLFDI